MHRQLGRLLLDGLEAALDERIAILRFILLFPFVSTLNVRLELDRANELATALLEGARLLRSLII